MVNATSNTERLVATLIATQATSYFNLPTTLFGAIHLAVEEILLAVQNWNWNWNWDWDWIDRTGSVLGGVDLGIVTGNQYLPILIICIVAYFCMKKTHIMLKTIGVMNSYYGCRISKYINEVLLKRYSLEIMDENTQLLVVNEHLFANKLFLSPYNQYRLFKYEYDKLPSTLYSYSTIKSLYIPDLDKRYYFHDDDVTGYIIWKGKSVTINVTKSRKIEENGKLRSIQEDVEAIIRVPILTITINKNVQDYLDELRQKKNKKEKTVDRFFIHMQEGNVENRIFSKKIFAITYYGDNLQKYYEKHHLPEAKKTYIDTFFHPLKDQLWRKIKEIHFDPEKIIKLGQYAQCSLCLYGPPGTGKSSFAYRIARTLGRGLLSIDIRGITSKIELRRIINGTALNKTKCGVLNDSIQLNTHPLVAVIVLDEFDKAILTLQARAQLKEKRARERMKKINNYFNGIYMDYAEPVIHRGIMNYGTNGYGTNGYSTNGYSTNGYSTNGYGTAGHSTGRKKNKNLSKHDDSNSDDSDSDEDPKDVKEDVKEDVKDGKDVKDVKDDGKNVKDDGKDGEIDEAINKYSSTDDDLTVDDLLDIIQGACSNKGAIIIAMTNNYRKIREICPRLFRDGRFKPIYFGYPSKETVNEITEFYYGKSITGSEFNDIPNIVKLSTARLTDKAVASKFEYPGDTLEDKERQFDFFIKHLRHDIANYKLGDHFSEYEGCEETDLSDMNDQLSNTD